MIVPSRSALNRMPSSTALVSCWSTTFGAELEPAIVHGHPTLTLTLGAADSRLPESSTARALMFVLGAPCAFQV